MAGAKRALSEMFPNQEIEEDEEHPGPIIEVKKNLMDVFVLDTPMKNAVSSNLEPGQEHMKVYLRIRPMTVEEQGSREDQNCLEVENENTVSTHAPKDSHYFKASTHGLGKTTHKFTFSKIFNQSTSQKEFFDSTMLAMVKDFVDGQNCLVFSYGVTNAGKTYTIQGNPKDAGLLPRALDVLFNSIEGKQWDGMNIKPRMFLDVVQLTPEQEAEERKLKDNVMKMSLEEDTDVMSLLGDDAGSDISKATNTTVSSESSMNGQHSKDSVECFDDLMEIENRVREETAIDVEDQGMVKFSVWISFAEIYNEQIYDLLEPISKKKNQRRTCLRLSEDRKGSPYVKGLKYINVRSADEAYKLMTIGQRNLKKACTKLNHNSSRSHCIFNIKVLRVLNKQNPHVARVSMLTLCDLAGSERYSKTQSTGERLKEAGNINTSLHTLGRCLETLRYNQTHKENNRLIPFREGKLTRLFQNFFSGKGKAAMVVNVNQCASMFDETFHVFKFSAIAKQIVVVQKPEPKPKTSFKQNARRSSMAWACSAHQEIEAKTDLATTVPLPCMSDDDLEDSEVDSEIQELHHRISVLKERLKKEKDDRMMDELRIREEVCKEMMSQIVKIEMNYSEMLKKKEAIHEERLEQKIKLLKSIQQPSSNAKQSASDKMEDEEDEWVSSVLLHAEKTKSEEKDKSISNLTKQLDELRQQLKSEQRKSQQLQLEVSSREDSMRVAEGEDLTQKGLVESLSRKLEDAREQIEEKEQEIKELNDTLTEAADTFMQKETEIKKLQEVLKSDEEKLKQQEETIKDLQKLLDESKAALEVANDKLTSRDIQILDLQTESEELQGSRLSACSSIGSSSGQFLVVPKPVITVTSPECGRDITDYIVKPSKGCEGNKVLRVVITPVKGGKLLPKPTKTSILRMKSTTPTKEKTRLKNNTKRKINVAESGAAPDSAAKRQRTSIVKTKRVSSVRSRVSLVGRTRHTSGRGVLSAKYNLRTRR